MSTNNGRGVLRKESSAQSGNQTKNSGGGKHRNKSRFRYRVFILVCAAILSLFFVLLFNDALALTKKDAAVTITLSEGMSTAQIANLLHDNDLINYKWTFKLFSAITKSDGKYKYGTYDLNKSMDYLELTTRLKKRAQSTTTVWVTIPEGKELREIFETLEKNGVSTAKQLTETMKTHDFGYDFLKEVPKERENKFEGYIFPDTYEFYKNETPVNVLDKMLKNFDSKFDEDARARAKERGMTIDEVVRLASVIEREAASDGDRDKVASVFVNRLESKDYPYLQSCATVQYVLKERKAVLSVADTKIDSKYNTYKYKGLPIGPIASPGKASITAALWPAKTDYYFFVLGENGQHIFSKTLEEHNKAIKQAKNSSGTGTVR